MNNSRKNKSLVNLIFGIIYQVFTLILNFVCKTFLIKKLGSDILGINSLYSNILTLLSLAELGLGNVMLFTIYKPLRDNDQEKIAAYLNYYKKLYNIIAFVIFITGLLIVPFLNYLISADITISNKDTIIYFLLFLSNISISYLLVYKQTLITANQNVSLIKIFSMVGLAVQTTLRIIFLFIYPNYKIYLIIEVICNFLTNLSMSIYVDKKYPYIKNKQARLSTQEKSLIKNNIKDTFLYKIGNVIINNTDSILISVLISTLVVGYVSNYNLIISSLTGFLSTLNGAVFASIGNMTLENDNQKSLKIFRTLLVIFHYLSAFCVITMFITFNDFITLWLKDSQYILDFWSILAMCLYFYLSNIFIPVTCYRENYGLFKKVKYYLLIAAVINIVASVLLCKFIGLPGIFLGTIICRLTVIDILEPKYLYKEVFKVSVKDYYIRQSIMLCITLVAGVSCYFICGLITNISIINFCLKALICFTIVTLLFFITLFKTEEGKYIINIIKDILYGLLKKRNNNAKDSIQSNSTEV